MRSSRLRPTRILAILAIGPGFLTILLALAILYFRLSKAGISGALTESFGFESVRAFGLHYGFSILLPLYLAAGLAAWGLSLVPGCLADSAWARDWTPRECLGFGLSALLWMHLVLWWQVPTALWVLPGLGALPFFVVLPLLAGLALAFPLTWLRRRGRSWMRRSAVLAAWLLLWSALPLLPEWLPRPRPAGKGGDQPCKVLMVGLDGLRSDTFLKHYGGLEGTRYQNAYTVIPATRLLWSILWGGDPIAYTIGHVAPSEAEVRRPEALALVREARQAGWKPRFFIDDGGTIGLTGRVTDFDDVLMPAVGWENFVNSNFAVHFPLYAVWENWFKAFPTTNPWAPLDAGLKEALRLGRGSGWVMFHSCLAHQPIFLSRAELAQTGRWWTLSPRSYRPFSHIGMVTEVDLRGADRRTNPFTAYEIRMDHIRRAWAPHWNRLGQDPDYKSAVRVLFSDHGERFHHISDDFQMQGTHGYELDPWECRIALLMSGPGFGHDGNPRDPSISLMKLRAGIRRLLAGDGRFDQGFLESAGGVAPLRYQTLSTSAFGEEPIAFRTQPLNDLAIQMYIGPGGSWFTRYTKSVAERSKDASVGYATGDELVVFRPVKPEGAKRYHYRKYTLVSVTDVDEGEFQKQKQRIESQLSSLP